MTRQDHNWSPTDLGRVAPPRFTSNATATAATHPTIMNQVLIEAGCQCLIDEFGTSGSSMKPASFSRGRIRSGRRSVRIPEVRRDFDHVLELCFRVLGRHTRRHDDSVARAPISWRCDGVAMVSRWCRGRWLAARRSLARSRRSCGRPTSDTSATGATCCRGR
jgi:hypothetical protein